MLRASVQRSGSSLVGREVVGIGIHRHFGARAKEKKEREKDRKNSLRCVRFSNPLVFSFSSNPRRVSVRRVRRNSRLLSAELERRAFRGVKNNDEQPSKKKGAKKRQDHMNQGLEYQHYNFLLLLFFRLIFGRLHQTGVAKVFVAVFAQRVGCDSTDIPCG